MLNYAGGDEYRMNHRGDGFSAMYQHPAGVAYQWEVTTTKQTDGKVTASAINTIVINGSLLVGSQTIFVRGDAVYDLFWSRVDYLLWKRDDWVTCEAEEARAHARITSGIAESLCETPLQNTRPGGPSVVGSGTNGTVRRSDLLFPSGPPMPDRKPM